MSASSLWYQSHRADPIVRALADRHYNRQKIGTPQFVPPGSCCVFVATNLKAFWVTSAPIAKYVQHAWPGAWMCTAFRNEQRFHGSYQASDLITAAVAATRQHYFARRAIPAYGMVTFVNPTKVPGTLVRGEKIYGYCYLKAGFRHVGFTKAGLWAWQLLPADMPEPAFVYTAPWLKISPCQP